MLHEVLPDALRNITLPLCHSSLYVVLCANGFSQISKYIREAADPI